MLTRKPTLRTVVTSLLLGVTFLVGLPSAHSESPRKTSLEACLDSVEIDIQRTNKTQDALYRKLDPKSGGIRRGDEARLLRGHSDRAVILVHGFAASPFEVTALGELLVQEGYTVYLPLLVGFGSSAKVANERGADLRRGQIDGPYLLMSRCFSEVSLIGFSFGGSLVSDFLLRHSDLIAGDATESLARIRSAVLLSPYFASGTLAGDLANSAAAFFTDTIEAKTLYSLKATPDLIALMNFPEHYNQTIPLNAARQVIELGSLLRKKAPQEATKQLPLLLAYSESDETISGPEAAKFVRKHFPKHEIIAIPASKRIPHQIALPQANPNAPELFRQVVDFLNTKSAH